MDTITSGAAGDSGTTSDEKTDGVPEVRKRLRATRINPHAPRIDGKLDDAVWANAIFHGGFTQKDPNEGEPALDRSEVAVVYDDKYLYVGARLQSQNPDKILSTVSRRDNVTNSERIIISLDTFHNRRTAVSFGVTASGVRTDYYHGGDQEHWRDYDWNPVWKAASARTATGWTAEMRIPFSQLRFQNKDHQTWGVNLNRWVPTRNEDSYWILIPKDDQGWASKMGDLVGIEGVRPSGRIELVPYAASDVTESDNVDPDDPFRSDVDADYRFGGDLKMGVGPNLNLDLTVNPDFGQVEADPAEVNLSAFETFFSERRPFFLEGGELLAGGGADFFYSRRIGAPPHGEADGDFVKSPDNTTILGAAKLTGRTNSGLSVGVLGAWTDRENAKTFNSKSGQTKEVNVEPRAGWGVLRLQQEFGGNGSTAGMVLTGVKRDFHDGDALAEDLRDYAATGGLDWTLKFSGGKYQLSGNAGFSHIVGTKSAIAAAQTSSARFFQRPDATHVEFDPTRNSLTGWVARLNFEKTAGKHWLWGGGITGESPEFELNDAGILGAADDADGWAMIRYRETTPGKLFQQFSLGSWYGAGFNFAGDRQYAFVDLETEFTWKNFMGTFVGFEYFPEAVSDNLTRGGPLMGVGSSWNAAASIWSSYRGKTQWSLFGLYSEEETGGWSYYAEVGLTFRPGSRWQLSLGPEYERRVSSRQYFDELSGGRPETYDSRYVFSFIERSEIVLETRLNYAFTPDLTLEFYAEPFASSGRYYAHGELLEPRSKELRTYGEAEGTAATRNPDGSVTVTDGPDTFTLENRDFHVTSLRTNLVLRWEWSPGSELFLVWQTDRSGFEEGGRRVEPGSLWDAVQADGDNFFAVKMTYWMPLL